MSEAKADELGVIIAALEAENFRLAAGACLVEGGLIGDEHGHFHCSLKDTIAALTAKLAKAERDREQAVEVLGVFARADKYQESLAKRLGCKDGNAKVPVPRGWLRTARTIHQRLTGGVK